MKVINENKRLLFTLKEKTSGLLVVAPEELMLVEENNIKEESDIIEVANLSALPATGETGKIYIALDTNKTYRWSGSAYVQIGGSLETDPIFQASEASLFVAGDKANLINHLSNTSNPHNVTKSQVGLGNVDNTSDANKPISNATRAALNFKLYKSTIPSSVYTTDAGGLQVMKPLIDFKDVLEFANLAALPATGEASKIYIALDTNLTYRWTGSAYVQIGGSLETDPIFLASEASNFVAGDKANLDNQSGINTGDETSSTIQTKRPLKTVNGESLEGTGNVIITIPTITSTSDLTNDGSDATSTYVETDELGTTAFSNDYNDLDNKPTIPTPITNHSGLSLDDGTNPHGTTKQDVGLGDVDNTSDANKPISTATQTALNNLVTLNTTQTVTGSKQFNDVRLIKKVNTSTYPTTSGGLFYIGGNGGYDVFDFYSVDGNDSDGFGTVQIYSNPEEGNQIYHTSLDNQQSSILIINYGETYLRHIVGGQQTSLYVNGITDKIIIEGTQNRYAALGTKLITGTRNFEFPDKNGTLALLSDIIESAENKLDKNTTAGVERAYIINADGSQGTKATSDFKDVLEFANLAAFPTTGETGKIYVALDTNITYRWSGSAYVQIGGISKDLYPIKYLYQATGAGIGTYGTNVMLFQGTQSDVYVSVNGNSYRKIVSATTAGTSIFARESSFARVVPKKGYQFLLRFRIADASTISDVRGFHGLQTTSGFSNTEISENVQPMCGIGCDGTDTNIHIFSRQSLSGTLVKIDTGFSKTLNHEYLLTQERLPNSNNVVVTLKNLTTSTEFTSTVVNNSSNLTIVNHRNNNASTISCGFEIQRQELNLSE